jgi:hypothetical protein
VLNALDVVLGTAGSFPLVAQDRSKESLLGGGLGLLAASDFRPPPQDTDRAGRPVLTSGRRWDQ